MNNKKIDLLCKWGTIISAFIFVLSIPLSVYFSNKDDIVETDIFDDIDDEDVEVIDEETEEVPNDDVQYFIEEPTEEGNIKENEVVEQEEPEENIEEPYIEDLPVGEPTE